MNTVYDYSRQESIDYAEGHKEKGAMVGNGVVMTLVGERLRELREARGWSQPDLAEATGGQVSQTGISRIETGQTRSPGIEVLQHLAAALAVRLGDLDPLADVRQGNSTDLGAERVLERRLRAVENAVQWMRPMIHRLSNDLSDVLEAHAAQLRGLSQTEQAPPSASKRKPAVQSKRPRKHGGRKGA